jgi:hypothetical protein
MTSIGSASLAVIPDFDGFPSRLQRGASGPLAAAGVSGGRVFGDAAGKSAGSRFGSVFKTAAEASLIGLAGAGALAVKFGSDAVDSASDLNESQNAVTVTYGKQAKAVKKLGRESAKSLGLSNTEFNSLAVRFENFAKIVSGGNGKKVVTTLDDLTTRASDFASVMNLDAAEAATLFNSGLAGETEPLRRFGIDMSAASVQAYAYANGIAESGTKLTEAQKIQARYATLMEQTSKTQGDFTNTSGELANQQRILSARFEDTKAKLGKALLPILSEAADFLLDKGIPAFERFSDWFGEKGVPKAKRFAGFVKADVIPVVQELGGYAETAAGFVGDMISGFSKMPSWAKKALVGGAAAGFAANKVLPGGAKGAGGSLLGLVTKAKPLPVFVVNNGVGGSGGGILGGKGAQAAKFGALLPILGASGVVVGAAVGTYFGSIRQGKQFVDNERTPTGVNPASRRLLGTGMGSDDPDKTARAYVNLGNQYDLSKEKLRLFRDEAVKFNSTVDKTPRQVEVLFKSKGYLERMREIELLNAALANVGAGGVPNVGADESPRGFGAGEYGVFAGANVNITANSTAEIAAEARRAKRKAARGGHG